MSKICFLGAGSTVFAKNVLGDSLYVESLKDAKITLIDIDPERLGDSEKMVKNLSHSLGAKATVEGYLGQDARKAITGADYIVNAIQVGGYEPCTVIDFEIPKKYGLRQTIGDTLGIGGIFRALRTIPVMIEYCRIIEEVAPEAWLLNYTNPMAMITGAILKATEVKTVGLCHSVQVCAPCLCQMLELPEDDLRWNIAGINHQGWLLSISRHGEDLYPEIKRRAQLPEYNWKDTVRFELMKQFGYYVTESSEHTSEYVPWFIKSKAPELIERFNVPLDEYPRRCVAQIEAWNYMRDELVSDKPLEHERGHEYASYILEAMETGKPFTLGGNVLNKGLITNLPNNACVEVMCVVDRNGVTPTYTGDLPPQCAALNRTNINVQELTIAAALTGKKEHVYQAALLDPHTAAELTIDEIIGLCDDLIEAHGNWLPTLK
ncbi:MAG TPA: alpha-glucosidase/alpha-galactosidase [Candidatus Hydrogenedentes bacterium]|nr:alpha-glucosidase/alpha-galactosidase [Candidatus Hydrogenedentota bacterium]